MSDKAKIVLRTAIITAFVVILVNLLSGCGDAGDNWPEEGRCNFVSKGGGYYLGYCTYAGRHCIETWSNGQLTGITCDWNSDGGQAPVPQPAPPTQV